MILILIGASKESSCVLSAETDIGGAVASMRFLTGLDPEKLTSILLTGV